MFKKFCKLKSTKQKIIVGASASLIVLMLSISVYSAISFVFNLISEPLTNSFQPANIPKPTIVEDFTDGDLIKKNVKVDVSSSTFASYVRSKVVINWKGDDGSILAVEPVPGVDYTISYSLGNWTYGTDGFYYYKYPLTGASEVLITECKVLNKAPVDGYKLNVEVMSQTVQSTPSKAVVELWGVKVNSDGMISK